MYLSSAFRDLETVPALMIYPIFPVIQRKRCFNICRNIKLITDSVAAIFPSYLKSAVLCKHRAAGKAKTSVRMRGDSDPAIPCTV